MCIMQLFFFKVAGQNVPDVYITGKYSNSPISTVLNSLEEEYQIKFYYNEEWLTNQYISIDFDSIRLESALDKIFESTPCDFEIVRGKYIVLLPKEHVAAVRGYMTDHRDDEVVSDLIILGNPVLAGKAKTATITGKVFDGKTGEPMLGATVWAQNTQDAVVTDIYGNYSITLPPGIYKIQFSSVGFETKDVEVKLISSDKLDFELFQETVNLAEVQVVANSAKRNIQSTQMGMVELSSKAIKELPSLGGEQDVVKSFMLMPGVQTSGEFSSGINVRGGSEDQNLYLINGAPVFNTTHLFGMVSVVNPDAVKNATLYKGHIPSEYGERISSVMDISTNYNDNKKSYTAGGIGLYTSRLMTKQSLFKDRATLSLGGRAGYPTWILHQIQDYDLQNSSAFFYDMFATFNYSLRDHKILLSYYNSYDNLDYAGTYNYNYHNSLLSLIWNHKIGTGFQGKFTFAQSGYRRESADEGYGQNASLIKSDLNYFSGKYSLTYLKKENHIPEIGIQAIVYRINPGEQSPLNSESYVEELTLDQEQSAKVSLYANDKIDLTDRMTVDVGLHASLYSYLGPKNMYEYTSITNPTEDNNTGVTSYANGEIIKQYSGLEPRISVLYRLSENSSLKLNYNRNKQYISLLSYTSVSNPADIWKLSDQYIKPISAHQVAAGIYKNFHSNLIETSAEIYYKHLDNVHEYINDADIEMNDHIETELTDVTGRNYGVEIMAKKSGGSLQGWISYTYSRSFYKTDGVSSEDIINDNNWYSSAYDKPHNVSVVMNYFLNKRMRFSATFNYSTGRPVTLPEYQYNSGGYTLIYYSSRNKYRLPDYHRLDLSFTMDENLKKSRKWKGSWTLSILNVYARKNAYSIFYEKQTPGYYNNNKIYSLYKLYVIGTPLPTLTYNFRF